MQKEARDSNPASAAISTGSSEAHRLHETCHDMRQAIGGVFALAGAALAEPGLPEARLFPVRLVAVRPLPTKDAFVRAPAVCMS